MVHGDAERSANKRHQGRGTLTYHKLFLECASLSSLINKTETNFAHPLEIEQKAFEIVQPIVDDCVGEKAKPAGYTEIGNQVSNFRRTNDLPEIADHQIEKALIAAFEVRLLVREEEEAQRSTEGKEWTKIDASLHLPMNNDSLYEIKEISKSAVQPMELMAQIYNGRHGMLYNMVHADDAIEYILDMDDCMWRRCLIIKPLTASEFGKSTMSSSIKAIVQGTDAVRNNIRYLGESYRIRTEHGLSAFVR